MEFEEREGQKLDLYILLEDFLRQARRLWILGLVLALVLGAGMGLLKGRSFVPQYQAYASFTVRVTNPLYGSISSYNERTAQAMADTFPAILTSDLLRNRVAEHLGAGLSGVSITANSRASIFTLTVKAADPQRAYDVLNAVIECYPQVSEFVLGSTQMVLLDESGLPQAPVSTYSFRDNAINGAAIGFALWCVIVVVMILLKNTIHNEEELMRTLNTPCLGQIPLVRLSRKKTVPLIHRSRDMAGFDEAVRLLRLRVEKAMEEENRKVLLVSSAIPGEGKTTIATNLAVSLAQKGKKVLLIDSDLRNPSVVNTLSTKKRPLTSRNSLVDYIKGSATVMDMIQPSELENLFVIPGGTGSKNGYSGQLSDDRMARLIQAGRNLYDYVILDTPPCSLLADAAEIAVFADAGLLVIRQDFAARDQIVDGIERLSDAKLPLIGCALNCVTLGIVGSHGYGYGYGYGYGKGYGK